MIRLDIVSFSSFILDILTIWFVYFPGKTLRLILSSGKICTVHQERWDSSISYPMTIQNFVHLNPSQPCWKGLHNQPSIGIQPSHRASLASTTPTSNPAPSGSSKVASSLECCPQDPERAHHRTRLNVGHGTPALQTQTRLRRRHLQGRCRRTCMSRGWRGCRGPRKRKFARHHLSLLSIFS